MRRLRVLAGPTPESCVSITSLVNTSTPHTISSDAFEGRVVVNIKNFNGKSNDGAQYFDREDRRDVTWSIQMQGRFLIPYLADDILFGNTFDRPLNLPWGSNVALKFMQYIDPTLEHDLTSETRPWALSPLISTMPHFAHKRLDRSAARQTDGDTKDDDKADEHKRTLEDDLKAWPDFPPRRSVEDDTSELAGALVDAHDHADQALPSMNTARQRRSHFSNASHRRDIRFGPQDLLTIDFCYGFLEFHPSLSLRIPGGLSFDLMRYWDGQPVRFVCCARKGAGTAEGNEVPEKPDSSEPWGRIFWCVVIALEEEDEEDSEKPTVVEESDVD